MVTAAAAATARPSAQDPFSFRARPRGPTRALTPGLHRPYGNARRIVATLRAESYDVRFESFAGGHTIEPVVASKALDWFQGR